MIETAYVVLCVGVAMWALAMFWTLRPLPKDEPASPPAKEYSDSELAQLRHVHQFTDHVALRTSWGGIAWVAPRTLSKYGATLTDEWGEELHMMRCYCGEQGYEVPE